jgi:hypothetical protein
MLREGARGAREIGEELVAEAGAVLSWLTGGAEDASP